MKRTLIVGGLAALTLAAGGAALAQDPPRAARGDQDGDGRLSRAEFVDGHAQRLARLDADGDGSVTADERKAAHDARRGERAGRAFARLDANSDGAVTRAEFDAAREGRAERRAERGERRGRWGRGGPRRGMARMGDGAEPVVIADARARAEQTFARLDANGDGYVTPEERRAQRGERRARRAAPATASE